jgi:crossover junction endodeoxyribonuclease RuvC
MRIAGLDLSTARIGYASPNGILRSVTSRAKTNDVPRRLHELLTALEGLLRQWPPLPDLVAIEGYSLGSPGRLSLVRLGELGGAVRLRLYELGVAYVEIPPTSVKLHATGKGNADKERMTSRAVELGAPMNVNHDEADAFLLRRMARQAHGLEPILFDHERDAITKLSW